MKKFFNNLKKGVAVTIAMGMVICAMAPCVQGAYSVNKYGKRVSSGAGYASYTKINMYDEKGYAVLATAGARMCGDWYTYSTKGTVERYSGYTGKMSARHAYGLGYSLYEYTEWIKN